MVSGAVAGAAAELKDKIRRIASDKLEVAEADLEFRDGGVGVVGVAGPRSSALAEIALTAYMFRLDLPADMASGLAAQSTYDHPLTTLPVRRPLRPRHLLPLRRPRLAHRRDRGRPGDRARSSSSATPPSTTPGTIVNPRTLDGQVIGGTIQGLGTALYEEILYDDEGRVLNDELRALPPALVDGRPDDDGRPPGDAVAVHAVRDQGRRRGRPDADARRS